MENSIAVDAPVLNVEETGHPDKAVTNRRPDGTFGPGNMANPAGRPKGKTLKEFAREWLQAMSPQEKMEFMNKLDPSIVWRMAEGNPHQTGEMDMGFKPVPILSDVSKNNRNSEDSQPE